jgi:hypothetical protein
VSDRFVAATVVATIGPGLVPGCLAGKSCTEAGCVEGIEVSNPSYEPGDYVYDLTIDGEGTRGGAGDRVR